MTTDNFEERPIKPLKVLPPGKKLVVTRSNEKENQLIKDLRTIALPLVDKILVAPFEMLFRSNIIAQMIIFICILYLLNFLLTYGEFVLRADQIGVTVNSSDAVQTLVISTARGIKLLCTASGAWLTASEHLPLIAAAAVIPTLLLAARQLRRLCEPAYITMREDGLRPYWRLAGCEFGGRLLHWDRLSNVRLLRPRGSVLPEQWAIEFRAGKHSALRLRLAGLKNYEERQRILDAIDQWAPSVTRDPELLEAFQPPTEHSYTELWLQSLAAPPKRDRLKPLEPGVWLQDKRYRIVRQIGAGGQGIAYLAETKEAAQPSSGGRSEVQIPRQVVLKEVIMPVYLDLEARRQSLEHLQTQAQILRKIDHRQIAALSDFFVEDHRGYLVLQHIKGSSLRAIISTQGHFTERRTIEYALQMCEILGYLHSLSPPVVHRDFTPENLMLDQDGNLILIDFDVAQQQIDSTKTATVVGKPPYMPPEQIRGKPTTRSDIYALGATLHFLLTGCDPEPLTSSHPRTLNDSVSVELDNIIARATSLYDVDRFTDIQAIKSELSALNAGEITVCAEVDILA
jgi:tRNA A-37 threonylcarbamoyl transferase component Bud32